MRNSFFVLFLLSCDDHKFTGGHSSTEPVSGEGYARIQGIIQNSCANCHGEGATAPVLVGDLCTSLVGIPSTQSPLNYIEAGSSNDSYLIHKLANTQSDVGGSGGQMPIGTPLSEENINAIADWIDSGASCEGGTDSPSETTPRTGQEIHDGMCMGCHSSNGIQLSDEIPDLSDAELEDIIINGTGSMPPQTMTEEELASLMTYLREQYGNTEGSIDEDGDGFDASVDCDDTHDETFPGAAENEGSECMRDDDRDGYGDQNPSNSAVTPGSDCNDDDDDIFPGAEEEPDDQVDSNCNGSDND